MDTNAFNELFYLDPYRREADLKVFRCVFESEKKLYHIACEATIFYPEGGGQAGDRGFLGKTEVLDTRYETLDGETLIMHITREPLEPGETFHAVIDWPRRFSFMQNHSGEHILSGLANKHYGYSNVGFHLGEEDMTIDFDGPLTQSQLDELVKEVNELVWQNVPLETEVLDAAEAASLTYRSKLDLTGRVRLIRIPNGDVCACCGTHVKRSGEIGPVIATRLEKWRKGVRITLLCGDRALRQIQAQQDVLRNLSRRLSLPAERLEEGLDHLEEKLTAAGDSLRQSAEGLWSRLVPAEGNRVALIRLPVFDEHFARLTAKARTSGNLLILMENGRFFLSEEDEAQPWLKILRQTFSAKGGGPYQLSQGTLPSPEPEAIAKALEAVIYEL